MDSVGGLWATSAERHSNLIMDEDRTVKLSSGESGFAIFSAVENRIEVTAK